MKEKINALILGIGGNVSQGIIKALRLTNININIIGACVNEKNAGVFRVDEYIVSPYADDIRFVDWLVSTCNEKKIDIIFTGVEEVITSISSNRDAIFGQVSSVFNYHSERVLDICLNKTNTVKWLKNNGFNYPNFLGNNNLVSARDFLNKHNVIIIKPNIGKASKGIRIVSNTKDLTEELCTDEFSIQEYVGDPENEYTVGCYIEKNGRFNAIIFQRTLSSGKTVYAKRVDNESIYNECKNICKALNVRGALNIQLRLNTSGVPVCFEINPRLSGTTAMRANFGFNDVEATIVEYILGGEVNLSELKNGIALRYDEELYEFE